MFILGILYTSLYLLLSISSSAAQNDCKTNCQEFINKKNSLGINLYNLTDLVDIHEVCSVYGAMLNCLNNTKSCDPNELPVDPTPGENKADFRTSVMMVIEKYTRVMTRCNNPKVLIDLNICRRSERYKKAVDGAKCTKDPDEYNIKPHDAEHIEGFCSDKLHSLECRIEQARNLNCTHNATNLWLESTRDGIKKLVEINKLNDECKDLFVYLDNALPDHPIPSPGGTTNTPSHTNSTGDDPTGANSTGADPTSSEPTSMGINHSSKDVLVIGLATLVNLVISSLGLLALKA